MENLTTPKAILIGLSLIAAAIATTPLTSSLVEPANAQSTISGVQQVQICGWDVSDKTASQLKVKKTFGCATVSRDGHVYVK